MKWFKQKRNILFLLLFAIITILYFCVPLFVMPDSVDYYSYLKILKGIAPLSSWHVYRGPSFPALIFLITSILGDNMFSILSLTYMFFAGFIISSYVFIEKAIEVFSVNKEGRVIVLFLFYILIMFNPILFGYFHAFLTEFVAILLGFIGCVACWRWLSVDFSKEKGKYILYNLLFAFLFVFSWFLKQPYITVILFPLLISCLISIFTKFNLANVLQRVATLIFVLLSLLGSIYLWNYILKEAGANTENEYTSESFLSSSIVRGITSLRFEKEIDVDRAEYLIDPYISSEDKEKIENIILNKRSDNFMVVKIVSSPVTEEVTDKMTYYYKEENPSVKEALSFWFRVLFEHPKTVMKSYYSNYLATVNIFRSWRDNKGAYYPIREITNFHNENSSIGLSYLTSEDNFLWIRESLYGYVKHLYASNNKDLLSNEALQIFSNFHLFFFKVVFGFLPFLLLFSIIKYFCSVRKMDKKKREYFNLIIIFLGFAFLHTLFHAITGAIIDRYVYIVLPEIVLAIIILCILRLDRRRDVRGKDV